MKDITIPRSQVKTVEITPDQIKIIMNTTSKFKNKHCKWCGKEFTPQTSHQMYCSDACTGYARAENTNNRIRKYRKRYESIQTIEDIKNIGTGNLGAHRLEDFEEEHKKIIKELKDRRLRK